MGSLGCCRTKPKVIQNADIPVPVSENNARPKSSNYEVDYIPPTNGHLSLSHQAELLSNNGNPVSPASGNMNTFTNNQFRNKLNEGSMQNNQLRSQQLGINNAFRQSKVPVPSTSSPIAVNLHDLKVLTTNS